MVGTYVPHAAGFVDNGGPKVVSSRFAYEDSHTLERSLSTGGYEGLRLALKRPPADVHAEARDATLLGRGGAGFPAGVTPATIRPIQTQSKLPIPEPDPCPRTPCSSMGTAERLDPSTDDLEGNQHHRPFEP